MPLELPRFYYPSSGGIYGFYCFSPLSCRLHELQVLSEYYRFDENTRLKNGNYKFAFDVQVDRLRTEKYPSISKVDKGEFKSDADTLFFLAGGLGFKRAEFELDPKSWLFVRCECEFGFYRPPRTERVLNAMNSAGQRQPDGSKFPDTMAEPEGENVFEKRGHDMSWEYKRLENSWLVSRFEC